MMTLLNQEFDFLRKTGRAASFGSSEGRFPFFTSSKEVSKRTDITDCIGPALIFGPDPSTSVHYAEGPFLIRHVFYVIVPKSGKRDDAKFFFYFLRQNIHVIESGFRGAGLKHVSKKHLEMISLPNGRGIDRRKATAILEKADQVRSKQKSLVGLVDDLIKSEFVARFGTPTSNTKSLPTAPLKHFGNVVTGNTPPRKDPENYGEGIEWIKSDNINTPSHFLTSATESLSETGMRLGRAAPSGSTLVTCIAGSPSAIGNAALADRKVAFNQQINAVIPNDQTDSFFLYSQFLVGKSLIQASSTKSMKGMVSKGKFQEIAFLQPPHNDQVEFGRFFSRTIAMAQRLEVECLESDQLFGSLAQRAFLGEL